MEQHISGGKEISACDVGGRNMTVRSTDHGCLYHGVATMSLTAPNWDELFKSYDMHMHCRDTRTN